VLQVNWNMGDTLIDSSKSGMWGLLLGVSACVLLFRFRPTIRPLAWVGGFSFTIYLFQAFGSGTGRRLLQIPGISPHVYFLSLLAFAVAFGVVVDLIASRIPVVRTLLVGKT
jgi:membrane-bound acyltransferase YfiQ involved in biofilm formation